MVDGQAGAGRASSRGAAPAAPGARGSIPGPTARRGGAPVTRAWAAARAAAGRHALPVLQRAGHQVV